MKLTDLTLEFPLLCVRRLGLQGAAGGMGDTGAMLDLDEDKAQAGLAKIPMMRDWDVTKEAHVSMLVKDPDPIQAAGH